MIIRPVAPADHAEWLRTRLTLWGGTAEEHTHDGSVLDVEMATLDKQSKGIAIHE
jgi:hypothetical protein